MLTILPKSADEAFREGMSGNQQKLVYSVDIYKTLMTLAEGKKSGHFEESLFSSSIPSSRSCEDIPLEWSKTPCSCKARGEDDDDDDKDEWVGEISEFSGKGSLV